MDNTFASRLLLIRDRLTDAIGDLHWENKIENCTGKPFVFLEELPVLTTDQLRQMLRDEEEYERNAGRFHDIVYSNQYSEEALLEACKLAGIVPGERVKLFDYFVEQTADTKFLTEKRNHLKVALRSLGDLFDDTHLLDYPIVERVIQQPHRKYYYRGENCRYPSGVPSIYRNMDPNSMATFVAFMKILEAGHSLDRIPSVLRWNNTARVDYVAICQHYGLKTMLLDITTSLKPALFFACCRWEENHWRPVNTEDIRKSKFGYLYIASKEIFDMELALNQNNGMMILPVGHQPMMRCEAQYAYTAMSKEGNEIIDIYTDRHFIAYRFEHDVDFANWIFEECDGGEDIYPGVDVPFVSEYFSQLDGSREIQRKLVRDFVTGQAPAANEKQIDGIMNEMERHLNAEGYRLTDEENRFLTEEQIALMDKSITKEPTGYLRPLLDENDLLTILKTHTIPNYFWDYSKH